jgi:diaminohydroxyphosphoribosylaminopyrimidine deaminase/5-amino-6-(5-phosphoribosylamino)uracil reductase
MAAARKPSVDAEFDRRVMAAALRIGRRNLGQTHPNPAVGCILVQTVGNDRIVVGQGWTAVGGRPHAEAAALADAGPAAKGATAYVTLEPCAHQGRAGPCADALIAAGVSRVVSAMVDPDPRTAGDGHAKLEAAGISVTTNVLAAEAARAHSGHIARVAKGRPHVTLKLAVSADGMIGRREGERMIVTGKPAFNAVQIMRTEFDAVLVGIGTVLVDDPLLTVRLPGLGRRSPVRVILDKDARLPPTARLLQSTGEAPLLIYVGSDAPAERVAALTAAGAEVAVVDAGSGGLNLAEVLTDLAHRGITRVLTEGGAQVASSFVSADLLDEVVLFRAAVVVGPDGVRALGGMALSAIERSPRYLQVEAGTVGDDVMRRYVRAA